MSRKLREIGIANLKYFRKKAKLSQKDLSEALGKSFNYINGIENGASFPSVDMLEKIAEVLNIRPVQFFDENGCPDNIMLSDKETFTAKITEDLYSRLKKDIYIEVKEVLDRKEK